MPNLKWNSSCRVTRISNTLSTENTQRWLQQGTSRPLHPSSLSGLPSRNAGQQHIIKDGDTYSHITHTSPQVWLWFRGTFCSWHQYQLLLLKDVFRDGRKRPARHSLSLQPWSLSNLITQTVMNGCFLLTWELGRWQHAVQSQKTDEGVEHPGCKRHKLKLELWLYGSVNQPCCSLHLCLFSLILRIYSEERPSRIS